MYPLRPLSARSHRSIHRRDMPASRWCSRPSGARAFFQLVGGPLATNLVLVCRYFAPFFQEKITSCHSEPEEEIAKLKDVETQEFVGRSCHSKYQVMNALVGVLKTIEIRFPALHFGGRGAPRWRDEPRW